MKKVNKALIQCAVFLGIGFGASQVFASGNEVKVGEIIHGGLGCESDAPKSIGIYPRAADSLSIFYRDYAVALGTAPVSRKNCTVQIRYEFSGSRQFAVKKARLYFSNQNKGSKGGVVFTARLVDPVSSSDNLVQAEKNLSIKGYQSVVIEPKESELEWSACQSGEASLQYSAAGRVLSNEGSKGDSINIRHATISLASRPC